MLVKFIVSNFKSINEEQEFTMVAGSKRNHYDHIYEFGNVKLLKGTALYGSNSAGKSSIIKAIDFSKTVITKGYAKLSKIVTESYCRTKKDNETKNSHFEYMIEIDDDIDMNGLIMG